MLLNFKKISFSLLIVFSLFLTISFAKADGLVPCGLTSNKADKCTLCHLFEGIQNIINWGKTILVIVALVAIVAGAIMYIISAGNSGMMESAKDIIKQALWGAVIVLGAWVIVNTSLWLIASKLYTGTGTTNGSFMSIGSWYDFDCNGGGAGGGGAGGGGGNTPTTCTYTYSEWTPLTCSTNTTTQTREVLSSTPANCTGSPIISRPCSTSDFSCAGGNCTGPDDAIANNIYGVDSNILKSIVHGGEGCNPAVSKDGYLSCGYGQVTAKNRAWCGISGTAEETCAKVQNDVNLDINCAAKLIKEGNKKCSATDINVVASCYNAGQPGKCAVTTNNYCTRVSDYYNNCNQ